jgi:hypothetical protein
MDMKTNLTTLLTNLAVTVALTALACEGRTPVGSLDQSGLSAGVTAGDASPPVGATGGSTCVPLTYPNDQPFTLPAAILGTWRGSFINGSYYLVGSPAIEMRFEQAVDGTYAIHVVLAADTPVPAPASATDPYPPATLMNEQTPPDFIGGADYLAHSVAWVSNVLTFAIAGRQGYQDWCSLQTSYRLLSGEYNCIPGNGGSVANSAQPNEQCTAADQTVLNETVIPETPVSCAQFFNCETSSICTCDACGCSASTALNGEFSMTFTGDSADSTDGAFALTRLTN